MKENRSVIKSKKAIRNAFKELLIERHDITKITVKDIAEKADISKSTFYAHYLDIYDLAEEFENEIIRLLELIFNDLKKSNDLNYQSYVKQLINLLKENEDLYKDVVCSQFPMKFVDKLKDMCIDAIDSDVKAKLLDKNPNVRKTKINFITNGTIYLFIDYFKGKLTQTLDEICDEMLNAMSYFITA